MQISEREIRFSNRLNNPKRFLRKLEDPAERLKSRIFLWEKQAHAGQLSEYGDDEVQIASHEQLLVLAAIQVEAGDISAANLLCGHIFQSEPDYLSRNRYLGLTCALALIRPEIRDRFAPEIEAARAMRAMSGTFETLIRNNHDSIAVVGNSPAAKGSKMGAEIDKRSIVIRFNNYSTLPEFREDYGSKTDIWVRSPGYSWLVRRDEELFQHIVYSGVPFYYRRLNGQDIVLDDVLMNRTPEALPSGVYAGCRNLIHSPPSSGLNTLYWIHSILGSLDNVLLAGFELTDQANGDTVQYFDQGHSMPKHPHNWGRERIAFENLLSSR